MVRRSSERTIDLSMSRSNLQFTEQAETMLRALRILQPGEEIQKVDFPGLPDIIKVKIKVRNMSGKEVEIVELGSTKKNGAE